MAQVVINCNELGVASAFNKQNTNENTTIKDTNNRSAITLLKLDFNPINNSEIIT